MDRFLHNSDLGKLFLRLTVGCLMLFHGIAKMDHGVGFIKKTLANAGFPEFMAYGVFMGEVFAPLLLIVGFQTRIAGLIVAFTMVNAIFLVHASELFSLGAHGAWAIELPFFYLATGIAIAFLGAGKYSIDRA